MYSQSKEFTNRMPQDGFHSKFFEILTNYFSIDVQQQLLR